MPVIQKPADLPLQPNGNVNIPAMELPSFRFLLSKERGNTKNVLIQSPFALGDCVCAEPAIRYAAKHFDGCAVSLLTPFPELYAHIPLKKVYDTKVGNPVWDDYFVLKCYHAADELQGEFFHNFNMAIGDYIATCLFKGQIPVADRDIIIKPDPSVETPPFSVVIHAGKHWLSKTFPKHWWQEIVDRLIEAEIKPVLVGASVDEGKRGYVALEGSECIDLRDRLSINQLAHVLQTAGVVLTNDSAPYHIACSTNGESPAWTPSVGVFSTVRHFDFIGHWRNARASSDNMWNRRVTNLAKGCMWKGEHTSPMVNGTKYDVIDYETLMSWLPAPAEVAAWTIEKLETK